MIEMQARIDALESNGALGTKDIDPAPVGKLQGETAVETIIDDPEFEEDDFDDIDLDNDPNFMMSTDGGSLGVDGEGELTEIPPPVPLLDICNAHVRNMVVGGQITEEFVRKLYDGKKAVTKTMVKAALKI